MSHRLRKTRTASSLGDVQGPAQRIGRGKAAIGRTSTDDVDPSWILDVEDGLARVGWRCLDLGSVLVTDMAKASTVRGAPEIPAVGRLVLEVVARGRR